MTSYERSGWRDEELSARHRQWGFNCPCVDLDFLVVEYNRALPVALVEYKHARAAQVNVQHATYRALNELCSGYSNGPLPFVIARYWSRPWSFTVAPINAAARRFYGYGERLTEREFVGRLYDIRSLTIDERTLALLDAELHPELRLPAAV